MTDEQLNALNERMVFEVMGGHEELSYEMLVWAWTRDDGTKSWIARYAWRPTRNEDQALKCLDKIVDKGWMATIVSYAICKGVPVRKYSCNIETQNFLDPNKKWFGSGLYRTRPLAIVNAIIELLDSK